MRHVSCERSCPFRSTRSEGAPVGYPIWNYYTSFYNLCFFVSGDVQSVHRLFGLYHSLSLELSSLFDGQKALGTPCQFNLRSL
jgi:hypothetical protein